MSKITRKEARDIVYGLLFETDFKKEENPEDIYAIAREARDIPDDEYIRAAYFGVLAHLDELDLFVSKYSNGWKMNRLTVSAKTILRLSAYEMKYMPDIPHHVSLNEAVELAKKYDEEKAKSFINGVLNSIKNEIEGDSEKNSEPAGANT